MTMQGDVLLLSGSLCLCLSFGIRILTIMPLQTPSKLIKLNRPVKLLLSPQEISANAILGSGSLIILQYCSIVD